MPRLFGGCGLGLNGRLLESTADKRKWDQSVEK